MTAPRFVRSPHLVEQIADAERLAGVIAAAPTARHERVREELLAEAALASLRLDGSPLEEVPPARLPGEPGGRPAADRVAPRPGTWLDALATGEEPDAALSTLEYLGVRAALEADDLATRLLRDPQAALAELHRRLTRGLVAPSAAAPATRRSAQAVHDRSVGRVIFFAAPPEQVQKRLALLAVWLASAATREHGLVTSGVAHYELLAIHPYEAASGRLARAAARLLLRARGLDPGGLAAVEPVLAADPLGYYEEVAATLRRRDLTVWLERWGEAVTGGLRRAARRLGVLETALPQRAERFLAGWGDHRFTVVDYRAAGVAPAVARRDLRALLDAGRIRPVPGTRGLRYAVTPQPVATRRDQ